MNAKWLRGWLKELAVGAGILDHTMLSELKIGIEMAQVRYCDDVKTLSSIG